MCAESCHETCTATNSGNFSTRVGKIYLQIAIAMSDAEFTHCIYCVDLFILTNVRSRTLANERSGTAKFRNWAAEPGRRQLTSVNAWRKSCAFGVQSSLPPSSPS